MPTGHCGRRVSRRLVDDNITKARMPELGIDLVFFAGCPHAATARKNLAAALKHLGRPVEWNEWDSIAADAPPWTTGHPSPTVLVAGRDVTGTEPCAGGAPSCRADGAPTFDQIVRALSPTAPGTRA